ncbi:Pyrimidine monooxygenase RutA [Moraxella ovis]|nr:Pyrimidine monooxygenase RutA [Moraxella ovis]STZ05980.1 Pyrimidine monooxygenase RutA [Moraxella ovis]
MVTLAFLSAHTQKIALGTAGLIAPLRSPIHIAKMATSVDSLSHGRFLLGLSSGDRPVEYPAFGADFASRSERFRESIELIKTLTEQDFPHFNGKYYGDLTGNLDLLPKPDCPLPVVAIGRARQEMDWLANVPDAWLWHGVNPDDTANIIKTLDDLCQKETPTAFGYAQFVEVLADKNAKAQLFDNIYLRGGANGLADFWAKEQEKGVTHLALNLKPTQDQPMKC